MKSSQLLLLTVAISLTATAKEHHAESLPVSPELFAQQQNLIQNTQGKGFGPQSPRNIDVKTGSNSRVFAMAPAHTEMNLCNIHFHKNAEHAGGDFSRPAGDAQHYESGYEYAGQLTTSELAPLGYEVCPGEHGGLEPGDTIEVHYVHSSAQITPGPTLGACLSDATKNPQLRVEAQVHVLVNDSNALDFVALASHGYEKGVHQALHIPANTGKPVEYAGSTTGPSYNEAGSPFQVTWSVRPKVAKVNIASVGSWCKGNTFNENHAHGARNLVTHPELLSAISK